MPADFDSREGHSLSVLYLITPLLNLPLVLNSPVVWFGLVWLVAVAFRPGVAKDATIAIK
jgi:hypothetical protein